MIDGVTVGVTVIVIVFDVAVGGVAPDALLVITHVTVLVFAIVEVVKTDELVPTFAPLTFH